VRAILLLIFAGVASLAAADELEAQFDRAARDPAAVAALVAAGSRAVVAAPDDQRAVALAERLTPFCQRIFGSAERLPGTEPLGVGLWTVQPKDTWSGIARRLRVGADLLQRLNPRAELVVGREVKAVDAASAPISLVVLRGRFRLIAWRGSTLVGCFPVSVGKPGHETPLGATTVAVRVRNPEWTDPDTHRVFAGDDPRNVLGGFWLGFDPLATKQYRSIGIHGYTAEAPSQWLETNSSHGCVRLGQDDVRAIFDLALPGTKVVIRE
jgi:lipoprotein-anchoring transpeptidase ErfK/SrfK